MSVKWLHSVVAMVMLLVWLPAQGHCLLDRAGWTSDICCPESESAESQAPVSDPCSEKVCCNLDSPTFKVDDYRALFVGPHPTPVVVLPMLAPIGTASLPSTCFLTFASPELPASWQFIYRTALPPRAPSIAS